MITVLTNPCAHNFSKSPVICELETDNAFVSGDFGDKAKFIFYVPPNPSDGDQFYIHTGVTMGSMYFTNGIAPLAWPIPLRAVGQTDIQYYSDVLAAIMACPGILTSYNVSYNGGGAFVFEALLPGSTYSNIGSTTSGTGFSFTNLVNGTTNILTDSTRPNYKIAIDIYVQTERTVPVAVMQKILSLEKEPFNNKVKFDLSNFIDVFLDYYFPSPNQSTSNVARQTCKLFQIQIRELYGSPVVEYAPICAPDSILVAPGASGLFPKDILKAGLAPVWNKFLSQNQLDAYIWSYPLNLTTRPSTIKLKKEQPEFIYFCFPADCLDPVIKLTSYFADDSNIVSFVYKFTGIMYKGFVGCFPINPSGSVVKTHMATGNATKFTAQIVADADHATGISPIVNYIPDYNELGDDKILLFTNSMGGVDTFRSTGDYEHIVEVEKEISSRMYYTTDDAHLGDEIESQNFKTNVFKVYSGWKSKEEIHALEDILLAKYKVEFIYPNVHIPIIILSKKYINHKTNEFLKSVEIEYYHQIKSPVTDRLTAAL